MSSGDNALQAKEALSSLNRLDRSRPHKFIKPVKKIIEGQDVPRFLTSHAYADIGKFVMQLNFSMCPRRVETDGAQQIKTWELGSPDIVFPDAVRRIQNMLYRIDGFMDEAPPDTGPRRFGNISFRKWYSLLESRVLELLQDFLPESLSGMDSSEEITAKDELTAYLLGSFGSAQRLDYGTGHELSFLAFLGCVWKLGGFQSEIADQSSGDIGRAIVVGIIEPYLRVIRRLIVTYTLEPAGSHGVWGLDDHSFLPYIFGSAQYCPPIKEEQNMPNEGSLPSSPNPGDIAKKTIVDRERGTNMYFAAVGFINDVKTGPFWEHSPILFDISGIRSGWGKINKGMIKMYNAEVLSKFPVVQHFPFGSIFSWDEDPAALRQPLPVHTASQHSLPPLASKSPSSEAWKSNSLHQESTRAPWAR